MMSIHDKEAESPLIAPSPTTPKFKMHPEEIEDEDDDPIPKPHQGFRHT